MAAGINTWSVFRQQCCFSGITRAAARALLVWLSWGCGEEPALVPFTWALINMELLVFLCIPLEYTANAHVVGREINLEGSISPVTIPCRWAVAADVNWAVGNILAGWINSPVGKNPQKSWSVGQAGWGGRCSSTGGQEPGAPVPVWVLHTRLRQPVSPRLPGDICRELQSLDLDRWVS